MAIDAQSYFISPSGRLYPVQDHLEYVKTNPEVFRYKPGDLEDMEKEAGNISDFREAVLIDVMKKGWIRARFVTKEYAWSLQFDEMNLHTAEAISDFALELYNDDKPGVAIRLSTWRGSGGSIEYFTASDIVKGKLHKQFSFKPLLKLAMYIEK